MSYFDELTTEEILRRFDRVFGRDMTPEERSIFLLAPLPVPPDDPDN
jgi:hypothetical protein